MWCVLTTVTAFNLSSLFNVFRPTKIHRRTCSLFGIAQYTGTRSPSRPRSNAPMRIRLLMQARSIPSPSDLPDYFPFLYLSVVTRSPSSCLSSSAVCPFLPSFFLPSTLQPQITSSSRSGSPCRKPNWPTNEEILRGESARLISLESLFLRASGPLVQMCHV